MQQHVMAAPEEKRKFRTFLAIWLGGTVSSVGSSLANFVIALWAFDQAGSATPFLLLAVCGSVPGLFVSPFAGALADRWDRRSTLIGTTLVVVAIHSVILALLLAEWLELWHLYITGACFSVLASLARPAHMAAVTTLVPPRQFTRANGMMQFGGAAVRIVGPALAAALLVYFAAPTLLIIDLVSFGVVIAVFLAVTIPRPPGPARKPAPIWRDAGTGWRYVRERPGIFGLLMYFAVIGIAPPVCMVLMTPLVRSFAPDERTLAMVLSAGGVGALAGSLLMSVTGGPRRRFTGIIAAGVVLGVSAAVAGLAPSPVLIAIGAFGIAFGGPVMNTCFNSIWQSKTPLELHGRVFATITLVAECSAPLALLGAGPLADFVFEPLMAPGGALSGTLGSVIGTGFGRGYALVYLLLGTLVLVATAVASRVRVLRRAEDDLPDAVVAVPFHIRPAGDPKAVPAEAEPQTAAPA